MKGEIRDLLAGQYNHEDCALHIYQIGKDVTVAMADLDVGIFYDWKLINSQYPLVRIGDPFNEPTDKNAVVSGPEIRGLKNGRYKARQCSLHITQRDCGVRLEFYDRGHDFGWAWYVNERREVPHFYVGSLEELAEIE